MSKFNRLLYFSILLLCCFTVKAQKIDSVEFNHCKSYITYGEISSNNTCIQYDSIKLCDTIRYLAIGDFSIYVKENHYYDCLVKEVVPIKGGYVIEAWALGVIKHPIRVPIFIVTSSKNKYYDGEKIKVGNKYMLRFTLYNELTPISGIEYGTNLDILIGKDILTVSSNDRMKHFFICHDFVEKKTKLDKIENGDLYLRIGQKDIEALLEIFLKYICCDGQTIVSNQFMDTVQIKESLKEWSHPSYSKMKRNYYPQYYRVQKVKDKYHWEQYDSYKGSIDKTPLHLLLKDYMLAHEPGIENICDIRPYQLTMKILFYREDICTFRLSWDFEYTQHKCLIEMTIQNLKGCWKIVALNRLNHFYVEHNN